MSEDRCPVYRRTRLVWPGHVKSHARKHRLKCRRNCEMEDQPKKELLLYVLSTRDSPKAYVN